MNRKISWIGWLFIGLVAVTHATEDCHFNQYINSKLVSDYSAVLINIDTLPACLSYLKDNKATHKVVAFDAVTRKCCSVLQGLHYNVEDEAHWTTFEIREEHSNQTTPSTITTRPPVTATSHLPMTTTTYLRTVGICNATSTRIVPNQSETFGLLNYDFDPCIHLESLSSENQTSCYHEITTDEGYYLELSVLYDTAENSEYFQILYNDASASFTGVGSAALNPQVTRLSLRWSSDNRWFSKGFCLKVAAKPKEIYDIKPTAGLCEKSSTYVPPHKSAFLTILGQDFNACDNIGAVNFNIAMECKHRIHTDVNYGLKLTIRHIIYRNDFLELSYDSLMANISDSGIYLGETAENSLTARWFNYNSLPVPQNGFCIEVTSVPKPDSSLLQTFGICESKSTYISPNSTVTFSLNSMTFDACADLSVLSYSPSTKCFHNFYTDEDHVLNFYSLYDIGSDRLQLPQTWFTRVLSGSSDYIGNTISSYADISWSSQRTGNGKGFCIKVSSSPREKVSTAAVTGVCDTARTYVSPDIPNPKAFSISSYDDRDCSSLDGMTYRAYTDCWHELYTDDDHVLRIEVLYNISFDQLAVFADLVVRRNLVGDGLLEASSINNSVIIRWSSDKPTIPVPGFCFSVKPYPKEADTTDVTKGICNSGRTYVAPSSENVFSVVPYDFDAFANFENISYPNNYECQHEIYTDAGYTLDFSVKYSTQTGFDFLQLFYASITATLTGESTYNGYFNDNSVILRWKSDKGTSGNGFAMKVAAVNTIPRPPDSDNYIKGVCSMPTIYVDSENPTTVSIYSYPYEECNLQLVNFYGNSQNCESTVLSSGSFTNIAYEIQYATASRSDYLQIDDVNAVSTFFNGYGSSSGVVRSPLKLKWLSGLAQKQKGFCLKLRLTNATATGPVQNQISNFGRNQNAKTRDIAAETKLSHGICSNSHASVDLKVNEESFFSKSPVGVSQCLGLKSLNLGGNSKNCKLTVKTSGSSFDYSLEYSTQGASNLRITANSLSLGNYHGTGSISGTFNHQEITLNWSSNDANAGFCLKLIPRN